MAIKTVCGVLTNDEWPTCGHEGMASHSTTVSRSRLGEGLGVPIGTQVAVWYRLDLQVRILAGGS